MSLRTDDLQINNLKLIQDTDLFCFGTDAVLLANFAKPKKGSVMLDIGTGNAIIPVLLTAKTEASIIYGLEIQQKSFELANKNVALNSLSDTVKIVLGDINDSGIENPDDALKIARHEIKCTLSGIVKNASRLLKPSGKLSMVHKPERLAEIIYTFKQYGIEPKRLQLVYPKLNAVPCLILIEGTKGGRPELKFEKPLYVYDEDGNYSVDIKKLYQKKRD